MEQVSLGVAESLDGSAKAKAEERFDRFWQAYPRRDGKRVGKAEAKRVWMRMKPDEHVAAWRGVRNYAASGWKPKDAHRWLRDRCWEDWQDEATPEPQHQSSLSHGQHRYPFNEPMGSMA